MYEVSISSHISMQKSQIYITTNFFFDNKNLDVIEREYSVLHTSLSGS